MREKNITITALGREREKLLISRGVPGQDLIPKKMKLGVEELLVKMEPNIPNSTPKPIAVQRQYKALVALLENPLRRPYAIGIGSYPSDLRAKYLALMLMNAAVDAHIKHRKPGRAFPLWHRVYGGLSDSLRDKPIQEIPSMLILVNVNSGSSNYKLEKVRDLLEKFSDVPRIVVSGGEPPCDLFANKLYFPMKAGVYIGPSNLVREV